MKISAHILLKNESRFVWYSVMSVLHWVDDIHIWDTGSTDGTLEIIQEIVKIKNDIDFKKLNIENFDEEKLRMEMLTKDDSDWIIIVDADEIWWEDSIKKVIETIRKEGESLESIV